MNGTRGDLARRMAAVAALMLGAPVAGCADEPSAEPTGQVEGLRKQEAVIPREGEGIGGRCAFPVSIRAVKSNEYIVKETILEDGTKVRRGTGTLVVEFKNDTSGKTVTRNVGGPYTETLDSNDLPLHYEGEGTNYFFFGPVSQRNLAEAAERYFGTSTFPGLTVANGHVDVEYVFNGGVFAVDFELSGHIENLCETLSE
ncbi:MAG: hypothetical protein QM778_31120 [Myxococcales bacterium]